MRTPATPFAAELGQTIGFRPASRRAKFRFPCSQMTFATHGSRDGPGGENVGPAFRITIVYGAVDGSASRNISSVTTGNALSSVYFIWLDGSLRQPDDMTLRVDEVGEGEVVARDLHWRNEDLAPELLDLLQVSRRVVDLDEEGHVTHVAILACPYASADAPIGGGDQAVVHVSRGALDL